MSALTQKTNWPLILTLWLAGMSAAMQFSQVSVTFATLQAHYGISESAMSWLLSITSLFGVVFAACAGLFIQRWGYKHILLMALFLGGALSLVESTLPPLRVMFALRVLEGISHLAIVVTAPTLMAAAIVNSSQPASTSRSALKKRMRPHKPTNSQPNWSAG